MLYEENCLREIYYRINIECLSLYSVCVILNGFLYFVMFQFFSFLSICEINSVAKHTHHTNLHNNFPHQLKCVLSSRCRRRCCCLFQQWVFMRFKINNYSGWCIQVFLLFCSTSVFVVCFVDHICCVWCSILYVWLMVKSQGQTQCTIFYSYRSNLYQIDDMLAK